MPNNTKRIYALLVGINDYPQSVGRLQGCVNDVGAVADWLGRAYPGRLALECLTDAQAAAAPEPLIEVGGELRGHPVIDRLGGGDDRRAASVQQPLDLGRGGAAVEEHQLQPPLLAEEGGQTRGVGRTFA